MKTKILILLIAFGNFSCRPQTENENESQRQDTTLISMKYQKIDSANSCEILNGKVYSYLPRSGNELHLFTLKFDCDYDSLKGLLIGPDPEGEHGLFFYKAQLINPLIDDSANIEFSIVPGKLYEKQITLENYTEEFESSGRTRFEFFYRGKFLSDTAIVLNCASEFYGCYTNEEMIFRLRK